MKAWLRLYGFTIALISIFLFIMFGFRFYYVPTPSMFPTFNSGSRVLAVKTIVPTFNNINRGDVVVFSSPGNIGYARTGDPVVKRVIGIPGDRISIINGKIYVNEQKSPWQGVGTTVGGRDSIVPPESIYVAGDNRSYSIDSRSFGSIPADSVTSKAVLVYLPELRIIK